MLYLASMVLKQYEDQGTPAEVRPVVVWACQYLFSQYQRSMHELLDNLPNRPAAWKVKLAVFPLGGHFHMPADKLEQEIAGLVTHNTETRSRLIDGVYLTPNENNQVGKLNAGLALADQCDPLINKLRKAVKGGQLPDLMGMELIDAAERSGVLNSEETARLRDFDKNIMDIINVDDFAYDAFSRPSI
jgi:acyl-CoA dehydrogenase